MFGLVCLDFFSLLSERCAEIFTYWFFISAVSKHNVFLLSEINNMCCSVQYVYEHGGSRLFSPVTCQVLD